MARPRYEKTEQGQPEGLCKNPKKRFRGVGVDCKC